MSSLYPDESYCTSDLGRILYQLKTDWSCVSSVTSITEEKHLAGSHTVYTVEIECTPVAPQLAHDFSHRIFILSTRFKEMAKLHAAISKLHKQLYLRGTFPVFPPAKLIGSADPAVIQERRHGIEACLNFVFDSEVLRKSRLLHEFVEKAKEKTYIAYEITGNEVFYDNSSSILDQPNSHSRYIFTVLSPTHSLFSATPILQITSHLWSQHTSKSIGDDFEFPDVAIAAEVAGEQRVPRKSSMRRLFPRLRGGHNQHIEIEEPAADYLVTAGKLVATAQRAEEEHAYELAFQCYKSAASSLIQCLGSCGVQIESDMTKRNAVRRKTAKYLVKAEKLYRTYLSLDGSVFNFEGLLTAAMQDPNILAFQCSNKSMKNYRFIGVLPELDAERKVILVEETVGESKKKYVMKLIEKGVPSVDSSIFLPTNIPHMVQLVQFFETETHIILLLEYVQPGMLWSFLRRMFNEAESRHVLWLAELKADRRRLLFTVGVDFERVVEMRDESFKEDQVVCTVGEDPTGRSDAPTGDFTLLGSSKEAVESQIFQVEEESPAAVKFDFSTSKSHSPRGNRISSDDPDHSVCSTSKMSSESNPMSDANSKEIFLKALSKALMTVQKQLSSRKQVWNFLDLPESLVVHWSAQIVSFFFVLHAEYQEFVGDLNADDILIDTDGNLLITYIGRWYEANRRKRISDGYSAPESTQYGWIPTSESDAWTLGALMFEMICGRSLANAAPHGVLRNMELPIPEKCKISFVAKDLLSMYAPLGLFHILKIHFFRLLVPTASLRPSFDEVRAHPFFRHIDWLLYDNPTTSSTTAPVSQKPIARIEKVIDPIPEVPKDEPSTSRVSPTSRRILF
ncbi:Protein CBR-RSKD-1 [Caenorhabditis briggsae]|uniref:Protein CBR-RSKD-1 n=1 Tax=Caenorhabditis briggsae TaxID=6238 RepID=A8Y3X4_CAEBR|nr:Protein CBR-RSKD-1 [Caenorhabditis briggsae]CAP39593.2 Protein CBR-RSKD-1 [Caenorhabditis briggsae]